MKSHWICRHHSRDLIVFLNGWGMDACIAAQAPAPTGWDLLMFDDYAHLETSIDVAKLGARYDRMVLIAWSMGVWAAGRAFASASEVFTRAAAVNGTARPIHKRYGIPPKAYRATMSGFRTKARDAFYRRMCGCDDLLRRFLAAPPRRSIEDQERELKAIRELTEHSEAESAYPFDEVFIGSRDRIMPPENQKRFWAERAPCTMRDMPHYPFFNLTWEELLHDAADRK